jgi:predicted lipid-binding transport protein (Tim44 family)
MLKITPLSGLQFGLVSLMVCSAAIAIFGPAGVMASSARQDEIAAPPDKDAMAKFMARKLAAAQRALDGVARDDFDLIRETTTEMIELSRHEAWERMASPRFVQDTVDFVAAAEFLSRMADAKDSEGASLGFMRLTMTCTNCHSHIRSSRVALFDDRDSRPASFVSVIATSQLPR